MSFKTILAPLSDADAGMPALETARLAARRSGAHVEVLHVRPDPRSLVPYTGEGMDGSMIEEIMDATERDREQRSARAREAFEAFRGEHGLVASDAPAPDSGPTVSWREETGREDELVALRGRLHDLIVVGRPVAGAALPSPVTLEAALHDSGRPVLAAPPSAPRELGRHVAVAWEASPEAARAIAVSIQALKQADAVTVLSADVSPPLPLKAEELIARLAWHGVEARVRSFEAAASDLGRAYLAEAAAVGADLLVKGAYSQSRLRQIVMGGRTRYILNNAEIPVLLSK